jgi:DNA-binding response OmpR family regulator
MHTILIVDDDRLFLGLAQEELQKVGFAVRVAETPAQAAEVLQQVPIHAILMDVVMPEMDGLELLPRIRGEYPDIPVVVVSGRASSLTGVQAMRLGAVDFLRKPLNFAELKETLRTTIETRRRTIPAPPRSAQLPRLQRNALELSSLIRSDVLGEFLKDSASLYRRVIDLVADLLEVEVVSLMLVEEREGILRIAQAKGLEPAVVEKGYCRVGEGLSGRVAKSGEPLLILDLSKDPAFAKYERHFGYRTNSLMCVPVKVNGKTVGVLNANSKRTGEPFDEQDLALFLTFSYLVSLSLATAQLYEQLAASVDELATTNARLARATVELEARLKEIQSLKGRSGRFEIPS